MVVASLKVVAPFGSSGVANLILSVGFTVVLGSIPDFLVSLPVKPFVVVAASNGLTTVVICRVTPSTVPVVFTDSGLSFVVVLVDGDMTTSVVFVLEVGVVVKPSTLPVVFPNSGLSFVVALVDGDMTSSVVFVLEVGVVM